MSRILIVILSVFMFSNTWAQTVGEIFPVKPGNQVNDLVNKLEITLENDSRSSTEFKYNLPNKMGYIIATLDKAKFDKETLVIKFAIGSYAVWKFVGKEYFFENPLNAFQPSIARCELVYNVRGKTGLKFTARMITPCGNSYVEFSNAVNEVLGFDTPLLKESVIKAEGEDDPDQASNLKPKRGVASESVKKTEPKKTKKK